MAQHVEILDMGPHEYAVTVTEGVDTTNHRFTLDEEFLDELGIVDLDEEQLIRESVDFLLDRVPADSIGDDVDLTDIVATYDDYLPELTARLTA